MRAWLFKCRPHSRGCKERSQNTHAPLDFLAFSSLLNCWSRCNVYSVYAWSNPAETEQDCWGLISLAYFKFKIYAYVAGLHVNYMAPCCKHEREWERVTSCGYWQYRFVAVDPVYILTTTKVYSIFVVCLYIGLLWLYFTIGLKRNIDVTSHQTDREFKP